MLKVNFTVMLHTKCNNNNRLHKLPLVMLKVVLEANSTDMIKNAKLKTLNFKINFIKSNIQNINLKFYFTILQVLQVNRSTPHNFSLPWLFYRKLGNLWKCKEYPNEVKIGIFNIEPKGLHTLFQPYSILIFSRCKFLSF